MISQEYKQGKHIIKIESAESLKDAIENNFPRNVYIRCYVDGKLTDNYMAMIRFITENAKKSNVALIPIGVDFMIKREEMLLRQQETIELELKKHQNEYMDNLPPEVSEKMKEFISKINKHGVRVEK